MILLLIAVPSAFNRDWIAAKYHQEMLKALKNLAPEIKEIKYQLGGTARPSDHQRQTAAKTRQPARRQGDGDLSRYSGL